MGPKTISILLDLGQVLALALLVINGQMIPNNPISLLIIIFAVILISWSVWEMRMNRFYQVPDIRKQQKLVTSGPYKYIRNPMYSSQILLGLSILANNSRFINVILLCFLIYVFINKMNYEEALLQKHFGAEFSEYMTKSMRLIPFIY